jgi:glycosyltransferase involved in cell wall biosynthesis
MLAGCPTISVIIPAKNSAGFIKETLHSVLRQTWDNLDVVVVDDGSTDDTRSIVAAVHDARLRLFTSGGVGAAAARNYGFKQSCGQWVTFLDSDDLITPTKLESQLRVLQLRENSLANCAWAHFSETINAVAADPQSCWLESDPVRWLQNSLSGGGMMQTGCWLVPRRLVEQSGGWNESLSLHDDGEFFCRLLMMADSVHFVQDELVYYRMVPESLSRQRSHAAAVSAFNVCRLRDQHLWNRDQSTATKVALATQYAQCLYEFGHRLPEESRWALQRIHELGASPRNVNGGRWFRRCVRMVGFFAAVKLRWVVLRSKHGMAPSRPVA